MTDTMRDAFEKAKINLGMVGQSPFDGIIDEGWFAMFKAGYAAAQADALALVGELAKALEELADDFSMYYDDSEHAEGERLHTVFRARQALNKYRERKI